MSRSDLPIGTRESEAGGEGSGDWVAGNGGLGDQEAISEETGNLQTIAKGPGNGMVDCGESGNWGANEWVKKTECSAAQDQEAGQTMLQGQECEFFSCEFLNKIDPSAE